MTSPPVAALLDGRPSPVDEVLAAPRVAGVRGEPPGRAAELPARGRRGVLRGHAGARLRPGGAAARGWRQREPAPAAIRGTVMAGSRAPGAAPLDRTVPWTAFQHDLLRWLEVVSLVGAEPVHLRPHVAGRIRTAPRPPGPWTHWTHRATPRPVHSSPCIPERPTPADAGCRTGSASWAPSWTPGERGSCCSAGSATPPSSTTSARASARPPTAPSTCPADCRSPAWSARQPCRPVRRQRLRPAAPGRGRRNGHGGGLHAGQPRRRGTAVPRAAPRARVVGEPVCGVRRRLLRGALRARPRACWATSRWTTCWRPRWSCSTCRCAGPWRRCPERRTAPSTRSSTASSSSTGSPWARCDTSPSSTRSRKRASTGEGDVVADRPGRGLPLQAGPGGRGEGRGTGAPAFLELGVGAQPRRDTSSRVPSQLRSSPSG